MNRRSKDPKDIKDSKDFKDRKAPALPVSFFLSFRSFGSFMSLLWLFALATACSPAPASVPDEAPAVPVRLEKVTRDTFQPTLSVLGVVRPAETAEVAVTAGGRLRYPARFAGGLSPAPRCARARCWPASLFRMRSRAWPRSGST